MVEVITRRATVVDPTGEVYREARTMAPRASGIVGSVIGLLDNHRPESKVFMDILGEVLVREHGIGRVIRRSKPNLSLPCPDDMFRELLRDTDALVAGVGV